VRSKYLILDILAYSGYSQPALRQLHHLNRSFRTLAIENLRILDRTIKRMYQDTSCEGEIQLTEEEAERWLGKLEGRAQIRLRYKPAQEYGHIGDIVHFVAASPRWPSYVFGGTSKMKVIIWDRDDGKLIKSVSLNESIECGMIIGDLLIVAGQSVVWVFLIDESQDNPNPPLRFLQ
jgi:hypothetical protein